MKEFISLLVIILLSTNLNSQKLKNISVKNLTYTSLSNNNAFFDFKTLNPNKKLSYSLNISSKNTLTNEDLNKIKQNKIFDCIAQSNDSKAPILLNFSIENLSFKNSSLDSTKKQINKPGTNLKSRLKGGVKVPAYFYKAEFSYDLIFNVTLNNKIVFGSKTPRKGSGKINGPLVIKKSIATDTIFKNMNKVAIDKELGSTAFYEGDPKKLFELKKTSFISRDIKNRCHEIMKKLNSNFCDMELKINKFKLYTFKKKKTDYKLINKSLEEFASLINKNNGKNIKKYSTQDLQFIKNQIKIYENEISLHLNKTEKYNGKGLFSLYKVLNIASFIIGDIDNAQGYYNKMSKTTDQKTFKKLKEGAFSNRETAKLKYRNKRTKQLKELKNWIEKNPTCYEDEILNYKLKFFMKNLKDTTFSITKYNQGSKKLEQEKYSKIIFNKGKENEDSLWVVTNDSVVLDGTYIDSSGLDVKKSFYNNGKKEYNKVLNYSKSSVLVYQKKSIYVGDTSDAINYIVELKEWHADGSKKRVANWNETVQKYGGTYVYSPSKGEYVRKTKDYFIASVEEWHKNGQQKITASYMLLQGLENFVENERTGDYKEWFENGQQRTQTRYTWNSQGKYHAQIKGLYEEWYDNGQQKQVANYKPNLFAGGSKSAIQIIGFMKMVNIKGCVFGDFTQWYKNGNKKTQMSAYMKDGFKFTVISTGYKRSWHENGQMKQEIYYGDHGPDERQTNMPVSMKEWDMEGNQSNK